MSEVERYAAAVLEAARSAHDPNAADEQRVHHALTAALGFAPAAQISVIGKAATATMPASAATGAASALKLTVAATLIGAAGLAGGFVAWPVLVQEHTRPAAITVASNPQSRSPRSSSAHSAASDVPPRPTPEPVGAKAETEALSPPWSRGPAMRPMKGSPSPKPTLAEEVAALRRAQQTLGKDPQQALALLDELGRRYPNGALREEARVARILALCGLGRGEAARSEAREFLRLYPSSVHTPRVQSSCALATPVPGRDQPEEMTNSATDPSIHRQ